MARATEHSIRIIGGHWRGTRIPVAHREQLRPSADRVRETLFNWLQPELPGARCLDLFAGTGVLGFEALSRGAATCALVEKDGALVARMETLKARLKAEHAALHGADVLAWLNGPASAMDIVFLDPPFHRDLVPTVLARLTRGWLAARALVYVECERDAVFEHPGYTLHREGHTQQVRYLLLRAES
ncbi:MAG: 16S rRNA (guanine(966)-N(2))-methyltransferase RsmD [Gammaproteobacteria bacterium]|nr:16S rRNA (guanine(966)-N(2))-methyltransferase RsmD [Gammaproteobacteria bacterium]